MLFLFIIIMINIFIYMKYKEWAEHNPSEEQPKFDKNENCFLEEKYCKWAEKRFLHVAEQGNADAQFGLAFLYQYGHKTVRDRKKAAYWYQKVVECEKHDNDLISRAQCNLGFLYLEGEGVPQDDELAFYWWTKAAELGDDCSKQMLKLLYEKEYTE